MSEPVMYVRFDNDGNITGMGPRRPDDGNSIEVLVDQLRGILNGSEMPEHYHISYNPKSKEMEFSARKNSTIVADTVNDFIYEVPQEPQDDPDILIVQDIANTCWKLFVGSGLKSSLRQKGINVRHKMMFSVTAPGDPNVLYKTLSVDLAAAVYDNYVILPFTTIMELDPQPVSVFTLRRFDSYQFKRIYNEQQD